MTRSRKETVRENRRKRKPVGVMRLKMSLDDETLKELDRKGIVPRWFNDKPGRIQAAIAGGYEFISLDGVKIGDDEQGSDEKRVKMDAGTNKDGSLISAYLMGIKKEWHDEDQQAKEDSNKMVDEAIKGGQPQGLQHHGVESGQGSTYAKNIEYKP